MFYSETLLRNIAWEAASQMALRNCFKEVKGELGYTGIFAGVEVGGYHVIKHQKIADIYSQKKQTSQVIIFSTFLCIRRCKSLGSLNSFL